MKKKRNKRGLSAAQQARCDYLEKLVMVDLMKELFDKITGGKGTVHVVTGGKCVKVK